MERKLGDTFFFPTVFRVVILICEKKVRGGGLAWSAKENLGRIFREALSFCFQVLEGLTSGRKKKNVVYFHKIETLGPACNKKDVEQTEGKTSHPPKHWYRLEFIAVSYINKGGAPSLKCVERILTSADTGKSSMSNDLLAAPTTPEAMHACSDAQ